MEIPESAPANQLIPVNPVPARSNRLKKKKKSKKKLTYELIIQKKNIKQRIMDKIDSSENIPQSLKRKYKAVELDPLALILTSLPLEVTSEELFEFFNVLLTSLDPSYDERGERPVDSCEIGETKRFALIFLIDKESVWKLVKMDSVIYQGSKIKIQRPKGFFANHFESGKYILDEYGTLINMEAGEEIRLYLGGIPQYMTDEQVKKLVESFGPLKLFQMKTEFSMGEAVKKGYCFFEYYDSRHAEEAMKKLNELEIGDKKLKIQRVEARAEERAEKARTAPSKERQTSFMLMFPKLRDSLVQGVLSIPNSCVTPSRVIQLLNMCTPEDLFEDEFFKELQEDILEECRKYGPVERVEIPRPDSQSGHCSASVGKAFVKFSYQIPAKQARFRLNGKVYNRRTVICSFYPEEKFDRRDFTIIL
jgi:splicing factor U2AF subunit